MKIRNLFLLSSLCLCLSVEAQTLHLSGILVGDNFRETKLYAFPMGGTGSHKIASLNVKDSRFEGEVPMAPDGFYTLAGTNNGGQLVVPFYLSEKYDGKELKLNVIDGCPRIDMDADNRALSAFNEVYYKKGRELWTNGKNMKPEQVFAFLKGYKSAIDSIALLYPCSVPVKEYLALWAYTVASDNYSNISHITGQKRDDLSFTAADLLEEPSRVLDTPMALYFSSTGLIIMQSLPNGSLRERLAYLNGHYSCEPIRERVADVLLTHYIGSFNYEENYETGLAELTSMVEELGLSPRYISDFKARKASVKGTPFPVDILLTDVEGNKVDFSRYRGYYVYVDLWASWCVPCCREVPYLQKLEKELNNDLVKFVSISIDRGTKEWKARMEALNMCGNQLINQDNKLAEALNVGSIPHFLIYDKEGKLFQYKAPRPSSGEELKQLLEHLR